jgi:hypothetical protein
MDLYPEIAVDLGRIPRGGLAELLQQLMGWAYRRAALVVALDEDMRDRLRPYRVTPEIIRPWVFSSMLTVLARTAETPQPPWTWMYSGNLGRAHDWETLLAVQAILEKRGTGMRLLFQGGGQSQLVAEKQAQALGLRDCAWADYVEEAELPASLLRARVLVVTQLPAAQGLLWPSKLGLLLSLPRPILWVGPTDGAIGQLLRQYPGAGIFAPGEAVQISDWLMARRDEERAVDPAIDPAAHRAAALADWKALLERLA